MIRPEAKAQLMRWREAIAGAGAAGLGLWWLAGNRATLLLPALALLAGGLALVWIGIQRARFRAEGLGPGSLRVDEGEIVYFGPLTGGSVALRDLSRVSLDPTGHPAHWQLWRVDGSVLAIPVNAEGAEALFDAFASLPGFRMARALAALRRPRGAPVVLWRRDLSISAGVSEH